MSERQQIATQRGQVWISGGDHDTLHADLRDLALKQRAYEIARIRHGRLINPDITPERVLFDMLESLRNTVTELYRLRADQQQALAETERSLVDAERRVTAVQEWMRQRCVEVPQAVADAR
jgi:hypothetical protein